MKNLTIVILNFNSGEYLSKCLESIKHIKNEANISVIAIDNASSDTSFSSAKEKFKDVRFVENGANLGFSKGYNAVLKSVKSEYILLLNPDCILEKGVIEKTLKDFENIENAGAISPKIILSNGQMDLTAHRGFPTPWASLLYALGDDSLYHLKNKMSDVIHEVDSITGAFFLTKKTILDQVGYLDERFFLYGEDIDLSLRIKKAGYKILYDPTIKIVHNKGISSGLKKHSQDLSIADSATKEKAKNSFYEAMILFYDKHYKKQYPFFITWLVYLGVYLKWGLSKLKSTV